MKEMIDEEITKAEDAYDNTRAITLMTNRDKSLDELREEQEYQDRMGDSDAWQALQFLIALKEA